MKLLIISICCFYCVEIVNSHFSPCTTPNGEDAYCIPIRYCAVLKSALSCLEEAVQDFVEASFCGKASVCCGSVGHYIEFPVTFQLEPFPPFAEYDPQNNTEMKKPVMEITVPPKVNTTPPPLPPQHNDKTSDEKKNKQMKREHALKNLLPSKVYCGQQHFDDYFHSDNTTDFIASVDEFPWLVAFDKEGICNGVLISDRYVLTVPYCAAPPRNTLIIGQHNALSKTSCMDTPYGKDCTDPKQNVTFEESIKSPNDSFSLVRLSKPIQYSDYIRPICLPTEDHERPKVNETAVVTSWDDCFFANTSICKNKSKRRKYDLTVISTEECEKEIEFKFSAPTYCGIPQANSSLTVDIMFPVGSGKPLMYNYKNSWFVVGIHVEQASRNPRFLYSANGISPEDFNWILENMRD